MKPTITILGLSIILVLYSGNVKGQRLYKVINRDLNELRSPSYLTPFPSFNNLEEPKPTLDTLEGKEGFLLDVQINLKFPTVEKRYFGDDNPKDNKIRPLFGYSRFYIDYGFATRIARYSESLSNPSLPITNRYGVRLDRLIFLKYSKDGDTKFKDQTYQDVWCTAEESTIETPNEMSYQFMYFSIYLHHYSNGQGTGVLREPERTRNNYITGDHSTSFFRPTIGYQVHRGERSHSWIELGYQKELGDTTTFFAFPIEQENNYGRNRFYFMFQHLGNIDWFLEYWKLRFEYSHIIGPMGNFPYEKKYRGGLHIYADFPFKFSPGLGFMVHYYRGRDYLNIRYDNPVEVIAAGISLAIGRYSLMLTESLTTK